MFSTILSGTRILVIGRPVTQTKLDQFEHLEQLEQFQLISCGEATERDLIHNEQWVRSVCDTEGDWRSPKGLIHPLVDSI